MNITDLRCPLDETSIVLPLVSVVLYVILKLKMLQNVKFLSPRFRHNITLLWQKVII